MKFTARATWCSPAAIQGAQYATLVGGSGTDSYGFGCNSDSTLNVVFEDFSVTKEPIAIFYEGYRDGKFTCYSTDSGIIVRDDEGRLNVTVKGADANYVMNSGMLWIYPRGVHENSVVNVAATVWYNGDYSPLIKLADGSQYRYNGATGGWQNF